jgi:hypothetical protein
MSTGSEGGFGTTPILLKSAGSLALCAAVLCASSNVEARRWRYYGQSEAAFDQNIQDNRRQEQSRIPSAGFGGSVEQWLRGCNQEALELKAWPVESVAQIAGVDDGQRNALDQMQDAAVAAGDSLASICPKEIPAPLTARLEALDQVLASVAASLEQVRPSIETFYASLNDEQKARLVAMYMSRASSQEKSDPYRRSAPRPPRSATNGQELICEQWAGVLRGWPHRQIEADATLSDLQRATLYELTGSIYRAAGLLASSCPTEVSFTPLGQIDVKRKRINALLQAIDVVRPGLARFADTLNDEQKRRLGSAVNSTQTKPPRRRGDDNDD